MIRVAILILSLTSFFAPFALGQTSVERQTRVVTRVLPPMVVDNSGSLTGFSIELWNEIAGRLNIKSSYHVAGSIGVLMDDIRQGRAEIGVGAISITSAREAEFAFSQPIMNAGLQIMVRGQGEGATSNPLRDLLGLLISWTSLAWLGIAMLLILIPAHIVWFVEGRHERGIIPTNKYFPGIFHALYWAATTLATQAETAPRHWAGRLMAVLWMFTGLVFVALYTAQLTATLTVQQIAGSIRGPEDLAGKTVATTRGSTAAGAVRAYHAHVVEVANVEEAYDALQEKAVDAVVFDNPVLLYYASNQGKGKVTLVGQPFRREDYGFLFDRGDALRSEVNVALLKIREDGTYQRIYDRWFATK